VNYPTTTLTIPDAAKCRPIIRRWLDDNGVTLREFGGECGIAHSNLSAILSGKRAMTTTAADRIFAATERRESVTTESTTNKDIG